ncbi:hypothetical protein BK402_25215 [Escherichia coli]|nr:hypothetical protein BK402_25215 [Escherichia coli]
MHFYVDETGQTGRNLFDKTQPVLSYGVLSSDANLDKVAEADLAVIRKTLGVQRLHAAELGLHRLSDLVDTLLVLQKKHRIRFDSKRLVRTVLIFTESSDQLSRATDRVPGLPASPGYVQ